MVQNDDWSHELRSTLSARIDGTLCALIGPTPRHICIIDAPDHPNVGDQAILLGELDFIRKHYPRARISFYDLNNHSDAADKYIDEASILLIHGGGNFGDVWPHHHLFRSKILERFRHKKIIQLPQSISFSSDDELSRTAELIRNHPDFTLIVRDVRSEAFAQRHFDCPVILCPDMAFAMKPLSRPAPVRDLFCLLRTDKEVAADHAAVRRNLERTGLDYRVDDWLKQPRTLTVRLDIRASRLTRRRPHLTAPLRTPMLWLRRRYAEQRMEYGIRMLASGRIVITDRLHAHIIASLLGIPTILFDSWDGKVSALRETWTAPLTNSILVDSPDDLAGALASIESYPAGEHHGR